VLDGAPEGFYSYSMLEKGRKIIETLEGAGFAAYLVGGCVRDFLMDRPVSDIDIATAATPDEVKALFQKEAVYATPAGFRHGSVVIVRDGVHFEITTFRTGLPTAPFGTSVEEDLLHRDFTINAIAYSPRDKRYIDPSEGRRDIENRVIRAVGVPLERFREDYLRMVRGHRFEAVLGFAMEEKTRDALHRGASEEWEKAVAVERVRDEINRCLGGAEKPSVMFEGMRQSGLLDKLLPELLRCYGVEQNRYHELDLYHHTLRSVDEVPRDRILTRWAALFHDLGKIDSCANYGPDATYYGHENISMEIARSVMKRLKFGTDDTAAVVNLVKHHMYHYSDEMKDSSVRRLVAKVGADNVEDLCILKDADRRAKYRRPIREEEPKRESDRDATALLRRIERMATDERLFSIKDLAISGREIMEIKKIPPSPLVGEILRRLYEAVLDDPGKNSNEVLRKIADDL